jgi:hypothetical protein
VEYARERVAGLIRELEAGNEQVLVPAPALSEVLVTEGADVQDVLTTLRASVLIRIGDFDERAAVELALRLRSAIKSGDPRQGLQITKSAMKFDRQIVAIALVNGTRVLYSDDDGVERFALSCGLATKRVTDLQCQLRSANSSTKPRNRMCPVIMRTAPREPPPHHPCVPRRRMKYCGSSATHEDCHAAFPPKFF